jgi:hypothetical protein
LTLNANYNAGWFLDDTSTNGWFFKLDTRGGNTSGTSNGLWLYRVPPGAGGHTDEVPVFGVSSQNAFFAGNVGIGTQTPGQKLEVAGNIKVSGSGNGIVFPDGSVMTSATAGGAAPSGSSVVTALNDPATVGTINDNRLSANIARLNSANTFTGKQTVNGDVSVSGVLSPTALSMPGFQSAPGWIVGSSLQFNYAIIRALLVDGGTLTVDNTFHHVGIGMFPRNYELEVSGTAAASVVRTGAVVFNDGSGQSTASPISRMYTTSPTGADVEIGPRNSNGGPTLTPVLQLSLPSGINSNSVTYMVNATVQFENTANQVFQNNSRLVKCTIGNQSWSFRLGAQGSAMDQLPMNLQSMVALQGYASTPSDSLVTLSCGATDGGTDRSYVFAKARRFTATRVESIITQ